MVKALPCGQGNGGSSPILDPLYLWDHHDHISYVHQNYGLFFIMESHV